MGYPASHRYGDGCRPGLCAMVKAGRGARKGMVLDGLRPKHFRAHLLFNDLQFSRGRSPSKRGQGDHMNETSQALVDVGELLGQNHAFATVAGRCSAAQASAIRRLREEKIYKHCTPHWSDFCSAYLGMSKTQADCIIRQLEQFGAGYFEIAQLTRISPETYRAIEPSMKDGVLHFQGEAIALNEENSQKVAAAVAELRRTARQKPARQPDVPARLKVLGRRCDGMVDEFTQISKIERYGENWLMLVATLDKIRAALNRLDLENGG
jgi:hypothetical protein